MLDADAWVIIKITEEDQSYFFKLMRGSYGGYTGSDTWDINSGIKSYEIRGELIKFNGFSGSLYIVHKDTERTTGLMASIIRSYQLQLKEEKRKEKFDVISFEQFQKEFDKQ